MSKYYYGFFRDTDNSIDPMGRLFKVVVKTKKGNGVGELLFSGSPFTVTYDSDDIFKSYKCSTAVVGLQNLDYNDDFVCESIIDNEVFLYRLKEGEQYSDELISSGADNAFFELMWCGYTAPNVYHQGYNSYYDEFELECQDKLSILKYYRWNQITHFAERDKYSLYHILYDVCDFLGFDEMNITKSLRLANGTSTDDNAYTFASQVYVLASTFADKDESYYVSDILDKLMAFFSLTLVQVVNKLYVVNYNAIATGYNDYTSADFNTWQLGTKQIESYYKVDKALSASNDTNLSVLESYDDYIVRTETDEISRDYPSIEWYNKIPSSYIDSVGSWCYGRVVVGLNNNYAQFYKREEWEGYSLYQHVVDNNVTGLTSLQFYGYKPSNDPYTPILKFYSYSADEHVAADGFVIGSRFDDYEAGNVLLCEPTATIRYRVSAMPISYALLTNEDWNKGVDKDHTDGIFICHPVSNAEYMTDAEWFNLITSEILVSQQPMVDITYKNVNITQAHPLCWRGEVEFFPDYIPNGYEPKVQPKVEKVYDRWEMSIMLKTANGTLYYDDVHNRWNSYHTILQPSLGVKWDEEIYGKKRKFMNNWSNNYHLSRYDDGVVISGYGKDYLGDLTIRLYRPYGPDYTFSKITTSTLLTNVQLEQVDTRDAAEEMYSDDTTYAYKDPIKFINEQNDETLQYTSSPKVPNVENLVYMKNSDNGEFEVLDYILDIPSGDVFRCEEHRLRDKVKQYHTPQIQLEIPTHAEVDMLSKVEYGRFPSKVFVADGLSIDYGTNKKTIKIVEKK